MGQTLNAEKITAQALASVMKAMKAIRLINSKDVDGNVRRTMIALINSHAYETNVLILASVHVDLTRFAKFRDMSRNALVPLE